MKLNKIFISFLGVCLLSFYTYGESLKELLLRYEEVSEPSKKTRIESLGHVIIFTRKDIISMQAYKLSDILKSIPFNQVVLTRFGVETLNNAGVPPGIPTSFRLYIDDHEVSSVHTSSPFLLFDNYPLDHIDHIEIYIGSGAVRLGNEPSSIIIKLYTIPPEKENASTIRFTGSSKKGFDVTLMDARETEKGLKYLVMFNRGNIKFDKQKVNNQYIYRNLKKKYLYMALKFKKTDIYLNLANLHRDIFEGLSVDLAPDKGNTESEDYHISFKHKFLNDNSLVFKFLYDFNVRKYTEQNNYLEGGVFIAPIYEPPPSPNTPIFYHEKRKLQKLQFLLSKEFKTKRNVFFTLVSYEEKNNDISKIEYKTLNTTSTKNDFLPFNKDKFYSFVIENQFNITPKNLLFFSLKTDKHFRNGGYDDYTDYIWRIAYISNFRKNWIFKIFTSRTYIPPSFFETDLAVKPLKNEIFKGISVELNYKSDKNFFRILSGYAEVKDLIVPTTKGLTNDSEKRNSPFLALEYEHKIFDNTKIYGNIYKVFLDDAYSPRDGGTLKFTKYKTKWNTFCELIFRKGIKIQHIKTKDSLNLSLGLSYSLKKDFCIKIKGENLLGSRFESLSYSPFGINKVNNLERKYYLTLEKVF